ncbi:hypothetical protein JJB98_10435 [Bradyrhizobium diazoefficiens]|nr:pilus assembly protein TadG-related protein [Bradyrhizobium diazoefficiens]QQO20299.1 hypothetical protein JJB98_10435 [Bradyrhizobium diazoefficiens]
MRKLLRNHRGSVAFATVVALVPIIGVVALGAEAGSWYVTKQHAQNAADGAAYAGGLRLACSVASQTGVTCTDANSVEYRGKQVAAQNAFCNSGDIGYPGSKCLNAVQPGVSRKVEIASLTSWNGASGNFVLATVTQQQPAYLAAILGLSTVNIKATAVAKVDPLAQPPCVLALKDSVTFQGSPTVSSSSCGISSNSSAADAIGFKGNKGINLNAPSYTVGGCSQTGGSQCDKVQTYSKFIPDPLSSVNSAIAALKMSDFSGGSCGSTLKSYEVGACYNSGNQNLSGAISGTYYFSSGTVKIQSSSTTLTGTATLILFGTATLSINGGPTIQLTAMKNPAVPPKLASVASLMTDLLIYDGESTSGGVKITGSSTSYFNGIVYVPNSPVTYSGNTAGVAPSSGCYQIIAYGVTFAGNTKLDNSGCSNSATKPNVQTVLLVQ